MKRLLLSSLIAAVLACMFRSSALLAGPPKVVASTNWAASFAKAAGATEVTVIAPAFLQHPPDYDPKPSDLAAIANADFVLLGGFEGFAQRMKEAVGNDSKLVRIELQNTPDVIHKEVLRLGELFGTAEQAVEFLLHFDDEYARLKKKVDACLRSRKPAVAVERFFLPWADFVGADIVGVYGPGPVKLRELAAIVTRKPELVIDNGHMPHGEPIAQAAGANRVVLLNFPGPGRDLLDVFRENTRRIVEALVR